ncbi:MAG TPA: glycoside hydrolase family 15 protein [Candidatus Angelobacter sp.]|nr:glycoside hydrolase family 15 protein [Candidatus Angelobacter sp.]
MPTIADYGIVGDCRSAALISRDGSVDWLCWPLFDSPSIFAAILDRERGGHWSISPSSPCEIKREYAGDSNVLQTHFRSASGSATLTDLMPVSSEEFKRANLVPDHELLRQLSCTEGEVEFETDFYPRLNYGAADARLRDAGANGLCVEAGRGAYRLRSGIPLTLSQARARAVVALKRGQKAEFSLSYATQAPAVVPALGDRVVSAIERSVTWWQKWTAASEYRGPYRTAVTRSALALKLLAYAPSGAIIAAPTTSLPERIGDSLNWDYRYCWLRDASLTTRALLGLGYVEEAASFLTWLLHATRLTQPELRILYTVFGRRGPLERELSLRGHCDSRPVRIGNDARGQRQLDVYGEVIDAAAQYALHVGGFDRFTQKVLVKFGEYVAHNWDSPDEGIWEPRTGRRNNTHSRLLCWTALDRLLALDEKKLIDGVPRQSFTDEREKIRGQIEQRAWNPDLGSYVSTLDGDGELDASLLRLSWYGFDHADSDRLQRTFRKLREKLASKDGLFYRYPRQPPEGAFGICGFWAVEHLALGGGTLDQAYAQFERLLKYSNELGLFAEESDPETRAALGNFPQAFTHVGLISAALTLAEQERGKAHPAVHTGSDVRASTRNAT